MLVFFSRKVKKKRERKKEKKKKPEGNPNRF